MTECRGLCVESCRKDVGFGADADGMCTQLANGRCSIYDQRPTVCRLWGDVPEMPCPHGCTPTLSSAQGLMTMLESILGRGK